MKVKVIQKSGYGTRDGVMHDFGSVLELPDEVATKLAAYGIVALVPKEKPAAKPVETVQAAPPQNAARRTGKAPPRKRVK